MARRRYIDIAERPGRPARRVHFRHSGEGPPLVLLHGSPGDGSMLAAEMAAASAHFSCFALDTPGFGDSDPLPGDTLTVADLAEATVEAMGALGLGRCLVYGTHTGAAIALELGVGWSDRASGLVLEGLPVFTDEEIEALFRGYLAPMVPDPLGGHLTSTWVRFRDQFTWFPWTSRSVARLNPVDRPEPADIDLWVSMFYRCYTTYAPAYRAACVYGQAALRAVNALSLPTVFFASAEDMLYPHLDRLPPLRAGQRIERLPDDPEAKHDAIVRFSCSLPHGTPLKRDEESQSVDRGSARGFASAANGGGERRQFVDTADGQLFVRAFGSPGQPALLILHDAPGTGLAHWELARTLMDACFVLLPDLPGNGESTAPAADRSVLDAAADALAALLDALDLPYVTVLAIGAGAAVAARWAARQDERVGEVVLHSVTTPDPSWLRKIAPELPLSAEGAHWLRAWLMLRDAQIYAPWFDGRVTAQRCTQGNFDAQWLHDQTCALMASRQSYHRLPREASLCDPRAELAAAVARVVEAPGPDVAAFLVSRLATPHPCKELAAQLT